MKTPAVASRRKTAAQIGTEWDAAADRRHAQIESRQDLSFWHVLAPVTLELLQPCDTARVLDVGCGTGELTKQIAAVAKSVTGVDVSSRSIQVAREQSGGRGGPQFIVGALEECLRHAMAQPFSAAVAAMTLMTAPDLTALLRVIANAVRPGGRLVATITHPCFWPAYWGYDTAAWFRYEREIFIEAPFTISLDRTDRVTTHIHRPLGMYLSETAGAGLSLEEFREPLPAAAAAQLYPEPWEKPRFAAFRWVKVA